MYVKKMKYEDFDGNMREETFYFHLSQTAIMRLELKYEGGFSAYATRLVEGQNSNELLKLMEDLIKVSYGVKSLDGKQFIQADTDESVYNNFKNCPAYSDLIFECLTDDKKMEEFLIGIMPKSVDKDKMRELAAKAREEGITDPSKLVQFTGAGDVTNA